MKQPVIFILLFFISFTVLAGGTRRALRLIEKEKFQKAYALLNKSLEKDSINPGAHYAFSRLFLDSLFTGYSIDSSRRHVVLAIRQYPMVDDKTRGKLSKAGINNSSLAWQKSRVDSAAFRVAVSLHTIPAYNYFIAVHIDAAQVDEARERRNAIAWEETTNQHTYTAYKQFIETYPDAAQAAEARELYNVLVFDEKTKDKNLASYINFLKENPHTPYRLEAEKNIFMLGAAENTPSGYLWFIRNYPRSPYAGRAVTFLYHLYKQDNDPAGFPEEFDMSFSDSLSMAIELDRMRLAPIYSDGLYGFMNLQWDTVFAPSFSYIPEDYRCGNLRNDVLLVGKKDSLLLIGRNGEVVFDQSFDDFEDIGFGLLKIKRNGRWGIWHKSGWRVRDFEFDDAQVINGQFIKALKKEKYGLYSFTGVSLSPLDYDEIEFLDGFYLFWKNDQLAVSVPERILNTLKGEPLDLEFAFDEVEPVDGRHLLCFGDQGESVLDKDLRPVIPPGDQKIYRMNSGWLISRSAGYQAMDESYRPISDSLFARASVRDRWVGLKRGDKWTFIANPETLSAGFAYDSLNLLSDRFAWLAKEEKSWIYFSNDSAIEVEHNAQVRILKPAAVDQEYLLVSHSGSDKIYDSEGNQLVAGRFDQVSALGGEYLLVEIRGKKGLIGNKGETLLKPVYDAIANYEDGYVSLLRSGRFGIFSRDKQIHIPPRYNRRLRFYNDSLLVAAMDDKWAIITSANEPLTGFDYSAVRYWNDSVAFVKEADSPWYLLNFKSGETVYEGIDDYSIVTQDERETVALFLKRSQYGLMSNVRGEVIGPAFNDIINYGSPEQPLYFAEKTIREAELVVAVYYDANGEILHRQAFTEEEFEAVYCD